MTTLGGDQKGVATTDTPGGDQKGRHTMTTLGDDQKGVATSDTLGGDQPKTKTARIRGQHGRYDRSPGTAKRDAEAAALRAQTARTDLTWHLPKGAR